MHWFETGEVDPNDYEMLFFALLVIFSVESVAALDEWAKQVLLEKTNAEEQRAAWKAPVDGWGKTGRASKLCDRMHDAYVNTSWSDEQLDTIGAAMRLWNGVGGHDKLWATQLWAHLSDGRAGKLRGASRPKNRRSAALARVVDCARG